MRHEWMRLRMYKDDQWHTSSVVEVIAPFGGAEEMVVKDLKDKVFPSRQVSFLAVTKDGKQVRVL